MILTQIPDPDQVLADLGDVTGAIWIALEAGVNHAREYFEEVGVPPDPHLAAHLTRFHARQVLAEAQHDADFEPDDLPNSGLLLTVVRGDSTYNLRIRKSDDGELPVPQSKVMWAFYQQPVLPFGDPADVDVPKVVNLVALWGAAPGFTQVSSFVLSCPRNGADRKADVAAHWQKPVPHPVTVITAPVGDSEGAPDLPISIHSHESTGEQSG